MAWLNLLVIAVAFVGHIAFWANAFNRIHATGLPEWAIKSLSLVCHAAMVSIALGVAWWLYGGGSLLDDWVRRDAAAWARLSYVLVCGLVVAGPLAVWFFHRVNRAPCPALLSDENKVVDLSTDEPRALLDGWTTRVLWNVPGNEIFRLHIHQKQLVIPRLPAALDGLSIAHLSDMHFTGRIARSFFEDVVAQTNALEAELVLVTGDIVDNRRGLDWIEETLAKLASRYGVYFILGNHDLYVGCEQEIRRRVSATGMVDVGGRWIEIRARNERVVLAGNELPWFVPAADMKDCPPCDGQRGPTRILLSHSPDQYEWARRWDFDLMLAGHTHGGQIRLPLVGPIFCPSRIPLRYSAGVFTAGSTVVHVSRGVSAKTPIRLGCPPELTKLILRCPAGVGRGQTTAAIP